MTQTNTNKPADTIRFGTLKGTIWRNPGKDGKPPYYSVNYSRGYTDERGDWRDTDSLSEADNLKLGVLHTNVANRIIALKAADKEEPAN
ncbi:MAG: hypothetical protein AAFX06_08670 [Planctomycetota bacterium]